MVGRRDGLGAGRCAEPLDLDRSTKSAVAPHLFCGCHDHRLAAWRSPTCARSGWERNFFYHIRARGVCAGDLGSHRIALLCQFPVLGHHLGDGL